MWHFILFCRSIWLICTFFSIQITQAYKRWNIEKTIKSYLIALYNDFGTYIKEDIAKLKFLHWDKNRIIAFDPENGNIEFELYLPTPADTLDSLPKSFNLRLIKSIDKFVRKIDSLELPKVFDFSIWDLYYKYKPSMNPADWVPPFDGKLPFKKAKLRHFIECHMCVMPHSTSRWYIGVTKSICVSICLNSVTIFSSALDGFPMLFI